MDGLRESMIAAIDGLDVAAVYLFGSRAKGAARLDRKPRGPFRPG